MHNVLQEELLRSNVFAEHTASLQHLSFVRKIALDVGWRFIIQCSFVGKQRLAGFDLLTCYLSVWECVMRMDVPGMTKHLQSCTHTRENRMYTAEQSPWTICTVNLCVQQKCNR